MKFSFLKIPKILQKKIIIGFSKKCFSGGIGSLKELVRMKNLTNNAEEIIKKNTKYLERHFSIDKFFAQSEFITNVLHF